MEDYMEWIAFALVLETKGTYKVGNIFVHHVLLKIGRTMCVLKGTHAADQRCTEEWMEGGPGAWCVKTGKYSTHQGRNKDGQVRNP